LDAERTVPDLAAALKEKTDFQKNQFPGACAVLTAFPCTEDRTRGPLPYR
jgi:hypothetical protein